MRLVFWVELGARSWYIVGSNEPRLGVAPAAHGYSKPGRIAAHSNSASLSNNFSHDDLVPAIVLPFLA